MLLAAKVLRAGPAPLTLVSLGGEDDGEASGSILVVDLESTRWEGPPPLGQVSEIIEIGVCTVDVASLERVEKRSILIKPVKSEVSEFCTRLTTLTAAHLREAGSLADATRILKKELFSQERLWASWGDYDRRQFERACNEQGTSAILSGSAT